TTHSPAPTSAAPKTSRLRSRRKPRCTTVCAPERSSTIETRSINRRIATRVVAIVVSVTARDATPLGESGMEDCLSRIGVLAEGGGWGGGGGGGDGCPPASSVLMAGVNLPPH